MLNSFPTTDNLFSIRSFFSPYARRVQISLTVPRADSIWACTGQKNQNGEHSYKQECHHDCLPSSRLFLHSSRLFLHSQAARGRVACAVPHFSYAYICGQE